MASGVPRFSPMAARLLTTGEAAAAMHVHPRTFRRWVADGWVTPTDTTAGGHYRWDIADVRRQLSERRKES